MTKTKNRKPTVVIVGPKPPPYHGVSVAIEKLLDQSPKFGFSIFHVDLADRRGIQHVNKPDFFDVVLFLRQFINLILLIYRKRPALGYLPISQTTIGFVRDSLFILLMVLGRCRIVLHLHGGNFRNWYDRSSIVVRLLVNIILKNTSAMIVLSESFKGLFAGLISEKRLFVVSNGVESCPFAKAGLDFRRDKKPLSKAKKIVYLGTLKRRKGVLVLIKSISHVIAHDPNVRFIIAGSWSDKKDEEETLEIIKKDNISGFVQFPGTVFGARKWEVLNEGDIFVFPGIQQEGQPLVVLEAMAAGLPVIYTAQGCLAETIQEGKNGLQINAGDEFDLAKKICMLIDNQSLCSSMANCSKAMYKNRYTAEHYVRNVYAVFKCTYEGKL